MQKVGSSLQLSLFPRLRKRGNYVLRVVFSSFVFRDVYERFFFFFSFAFCVFCVCCFCVRDFVVKKQMKTVSFTYIRKVYTF